MKKIYLFFILLLFSKMLFASQRDTFLDKTYTKIIASHSIYKIAVMPMQNMSLDPEVAYYFRQRVEEILTSKGYTIIDDAIIDNQLKKLGVQNREQISLLEYQDIMKLSSADAIMFGIIETSVTKNGVIFNGFAYTASLKLQDNEGRILWYNLSKRVSKNRVALDPVNIVFDFILTNKKHNNISAIQAVGDRLLLSLPKGPSEIVIDNLLNQAEML